MCKWGTYELIELTIVKEYSYTGKRRMKMVYIDKCIAPLIKALKEGGMITTYSCCGHGKQCGIIVFEDESYLILRDNYQIDKNRIGEIRGSSPFVECRIQELMNTSP